MARTENPRVAPWELRDHEPAKVRVLRYAPAAGDKSAMHPHPEAVVVVLKGGRVRYTFPDGTQKVIELKTGDAMIRPLSPI